MKKKTSWRFHFLRSISVLSYLEYTSTANLHVVVSRFNYISRTIAKIILLCIRAVLSAVKIVKSDVLKENVELVLYQLEDLNVKVEANTVCEWF